MPSVSPASSIRALVDHDAALAGLLGTVTAGGLLLSGSGPAQAFGGAALCVPLAWRSRWPLGALAVTAAASVVFLSLTESTPGFVLPLAVALYTVAARGTSRRTLAVGACMIPYAIAVVALFSPDRGSDIGQTRELIFQLGFALAIGEAVRSGRALLAARRLRSEQAERERELQAHLRIDEERMRIARDVHDVVAHSLATIGTQASVGVYLGRQDPASSVEVLESIKEVSTGALQELRYALSALRDDSLSAPTAPTPSLADLPSLVDRARESGVPVVLLLEGSQTGVPSALQVAAFRIVQEGLTNVMRHAQRARATVRVAVSEQQVELDVTDDGSGTATASGNVPGSGLAGMRERAATLGGVFEAGRTPDGGFKVRAVLPRPKEGT